MRSLLLSAVIFGAIPYILRNPFIGLLVSMWLGIMSPHRLAFGWASVMPWAAIVAACTLVSIFLNKKKLYRLPADRVVVALILFVLWLNVSPLFAIHFENEFKYWSQAIKLLIVPIIALILVGDRRQLYLMTWVLALSIGYYGIKGGLFTIATGGSGRVWGPPGSFIEENNSLALATIMVVPLFRYLQLHTENRWIRRACLAAMVICTASAIGSQSRGALLAVSSMGLLLWIKSRQKGLIGLLVLAAIPTVWLFMPDSWFHRMSTIEVYDQDSSAMGRINSWWMAWNLAVDRFPIGGGFAIWVPDVFVRYAPDPTVVFVAHSIYFQVLGEHGFVGLSLFLAVFSFSWLNGSWIIRHAKGREDLVWARDLAAMCQTSLVGYAVGGAFLSLSYFDLPYFIAVILVVLRGLVKGELAKSPSVPDSTLVTQ